MDTASDAYSIGCCVFVGTDSAVASTHRPQTGGNTAGQQLYQDPAVNVLALLPSADCAGDRLYKYFVRE